MNGNTETRHGILRWSVSNLVGTVPHRISYFQQSRRALLKYDMARKSVETFASAAE